jgi:arginine-tRNA-protein transferase
MNMQMGAYHLHYCIDTRLIAVSVIDIGPSSISAKYFYYDPLFSFLSLGTMSALMYVFFLVVYLLGCFIFSETALVRQLASKWNQMRYYYMGFYVHSCPKMRYKVRTCLYFRNL